jgi:hypothetical protein
MTCKHCGAMRRAEGGVKIGGRVTLTMLPGCPCSELVRIPDNELFQEDITFDPPIPGTNVYNKTYLRRFCPAVTGLLTPIDYSITCLNYPDEDLYIQLLGLAYPKAFDECIPELFYPSFGSFYYATGPIGYDSPWYTTAGIGEINMISIMVDVVSIYYAFDDPPIMDVRYKFSR